MSGLGAHWNTYVEQSLNSLREKGLLRYLRPVEPSLDSVVVSTSSDSLCKRSNCVRGLMSGYRPKFCDTEDIIPPLWKPSEDLQSHVRVTYVISIMVLLWRMLRLPLTLFRRFKY
jgi:hypothetical protein